MELIAIGNELLLGLVQDTNTHWLCRQISGLGGRVERAVLVGDDLEAIATELQGALARRRALVLTSGGLGPTADDLTLQAVAQATGRALRLHPQARRLVARRYEELFRQGLVESPALTPEREKMAYLPEGAEPLANRVGTAPGVLLPQGETRVVALPGVPSELKDIFQNALQPHLQRLFGAGFYLEKTLEIGCNDESRLAPLVRAVAERWPRVYVKSRARGFGPDLTVRITLAMAGERAAVERELAGALADLQGRLRQEGLTARFLG